MKKILLSGLAAVILAVSFAGCGGASNGLAVNTMGENRVDRFFKEGTIVEQRKAIIDDRELAMLSGAGIGAAGGAAVGAMNKNAAAGGLIGAALGGITGAVIGNEVVAYQTTIQSKDEKVVGFLKEKLPLGTVVEYTLKEGKLKNVEVVAVSQSEFKIIK